MPYPSKTDRDSILAIAMEQVARDGVEKLAIRSVASALNLAPNALYRYFTNLAALIEALADESRRQLLVSLRKAAAKKKPEEAVRSVARAYVLFAREQPKLFALTLLPSHTNGDDAAHVASWRFVLEQVSRVYGDKQAPEAAMALWAFLHGVTALEAAGVFGERKPASSFEFGLRIWLQAAHPKTEP